MKVLFKLIIVILVICCFSSAQLIRKNTDSQSSRHGLRGKVKLLVSKNFYAITDSGYVHKGKRLYTDDDDSTFFDINGNTSRFHHFDFDGALIGYGFFYYDSMFYRIEEKIYDGKGNLTNHKTNNNKYDNNGNIIEITTISTQGANESQISKINYKYDERGNKIEMIISRLKGGTNNKNVYKYNENDKVIEESLISLIGRVISKDVYEYDINGNRTLWDHFYSDGRLISKIKENYDKDNNRINYEMYDYSDGKLLLQDKSTFMYDLNNNVIEETFYKPNGDFQNRISYTYKYDIQQNWIERTEFVNGKPAKILERKIEYY